MGIMAGIGGLVGGLGALFGGGTTPPPAPPQFQMPNMGQAANNAFSGIGGLTPFSNAGFGVLGPAGNTFANLYNNPFAGGYQGGANFASGMGQNAALGGFNQGANLIGAGNTVMGTAFDPQLALYNRTAQQVTDQTRAGLEARGIDNTPYGAGVEGMTMSNFNIDWQNQQLQRQLAGLQGGGAGINLGVGMQNLAPGQFLNASAMPYGAFNTIGGGQNAAIASYLSGAGGGANLANLPIQDYLGYLSAGNQANSVANQNYGLQLQAQNQQFQQQMQIGNLLGGSLYNLGMGGFGMGGMGLNMMGLQGGGGFMPSVYGAGYSPFAPGGMWSPFNSYIGANGNLMSGGQIIPG